MAMPPYKACEPARAGNGYGMKSPQLANTSCGLSNLPTGCGKECTGVRSRDLTVGCHVHKSFQLQLELLSRLQL